MTTAPRQRLYLIDGSGYIFRAYHALPPLTRKRDGLPIGAVSGFCNILNRFLEEAQVDGALSHLAVIFDTARWVGLPKSRQTFSTAVEMIRVSAPSF